MQQETWLKTTRWVACCVAMGWGASAWAGSIQAVTGAVQGDTQVIRVQLSEPLPSLPTGFAIQSPARIALDFADTSNATGQTALPVAQGNIASAQLFEAGGKTRLVLNLKTATSYRTEMDGKDVLVYLESTGATSGAAAPVVNTAQRRLLPEVGLSGQALKDIDFRRGSDGAGRVVVDLGNSPHSPDVRVEGQGLVLEFAGTSLPEGLRRKFDVVDFGTPVQTMTASQQGQRVKLQVQAKGDWEHTAYQSGQQFVVEVRPRKVDPSKLTPGPGFTGERMTLNFQNIEVRSLLQVIADFTNFNIVTSDTVGGALTLRLKDVPWDQALNIIMEAKGLGMKKNGNVLWIAPKDEIDERQRKDYEAARALEKLEPLRTQGFQINYAKAEDLIKQIADTQSGSGTNGGSGGSGNGGVSTRFLSERGSAIAEPRTNQLFVTDTAAKLEEVANLLAKLDVPMRQVLIEARIVEARDTFGRSLGVKFGGGYEGGRHSIGSTYGGANTNGGTSSGSPFVNLPASLSGGASAGTVALSLFSNASSRFLNLELSAMEAEGVGKIISSPRLLTADQTQAVIEQGTEYPYTETAPNGATTVSFKKAVLKLEVVPQITPEGNIILSLDLNKDSRGETTTQGVAIDTKHIKTQVLVENGGTVVIGGIFEMEETSQVNKIPVLGDIPGVGNLFKNRTRESTKREMLVFITPRMVADATRR